VSVGIVGPLGVRVDSSGQVDDAEVNLRIELAMSAVLKEESTVGNLAEWASGADIEAGYWAGYLGTRI